MRFAHVNIVSKNWEVLVDFYIKTFDCAIVPPIRKQSGAWLDKAIGLKNTALEGAHLSLPGYPPGGPTLEIYQYTDIADQQPVPPNQRGYGHIAFEVDNVQDLLNKVIQNGGSANGEIVQREIIGVGIITLIYARDPEGNIIELQNWKYN